ncbi:polysaccharide biosynthesis protein [Pseudomonas sp. PDM15]|uniref:polysaccharide biosynthesis protein n=1 Tax=Pseudomonas sp. PDM15 TaxID=2769303 RepID=UPI00177DC662|nr:polysaccharide biosynthesis protein [Pseudomonas sp. PDM15]MBD9424677.1 polysaccharide biosynthesis protein [Pseudomonas sp. PDM15]
MAVSVLMLPLYMKSLGAEAYGLIGFFTMLLAWSALLDLGLVPTISRETSRYRSGALSDQQFQGLFHTLQMMFLVGGFCGGGGLWLLSDDIAYQWLNVGDLSRSEVLLAVQVMVVTTMLRWMGGLYRGVINGAEQLVWLSSFGVVAATCRSILVFVSMWLFGFTPKIFFLHQLLVSLVELIFLYWKARSFVSKESVSHGWWSIRDIAPVLKFSVVIAFTSSISICLTHLDKLVLSGILPLIEYGYFSLAVLMAGVVTMISAPVGGALMPRLAFLHAEGNDEKLGYLYRGATRLVSALAGSLTVYLYFFSHLIVYAWTGDAAVAREASSILELYSLGNLFLAFAAFPYYLQYARGDLKLHLWGNVFMLVFLVPMVVVFSKEFGALGAGRVWVALNFIYLITWGAYVHWKWLPGFHLRWIWKDILIIILPATLSGWGISVLLPIANGQSEALIQAMLVGAAVLLVSMVSFVLSNRKSG